MPQELDNSTHIFGIRHHGPGSARSVLWALEALRPDAILVEGPPDADAMLPFLAHAEMEPPVALLVYVPDDPHHAAFYPFAVFSPEWQAIRFGLANAIPVRFMDLPQAHRFALIGGDQTTEPTTEPGDEEASRAGTNGQEEDEPPPPLRADPLQWLAEAAGFDDGERWWEHMVEHRLDGADLFDAIRDAMAALRESMPVRSVANDPMEARREAFMRQTIRDARREGFSRIAVICGAWHAPALATMPAAKDDAAILKGLPKVKVQATWVPWTHGRLCQESGYGAGIESPGWYHHLWSAPDRVVGRWMTRVARLFREEDLDASSAHVIEAVRLAETLAVLRGRPLPGLVELNEAVRSIFCFGDDLPMRLIRDRLIVGEALGRVPEETPTVPLQHDLTRLQKRLKFPPEAGAKDKELDLRQATDLERSTLLHRLRLLNISWGEPREARGKGTFKETWRLQWQPEFAVALIEASTWGNTVHDAATARARHAADAARELPALTHLLDQTLLADLPEAVEHVMRRVQDEAALASDVTHLMAALPPLANVLRYGNVRQTDTAMVAKAVDGLVARIGVGLPGACASLNDEAAVLMFDRLADVQGALGLIQDPEHLATWHATLRRLVDQRSLHGLVAGRSCRFLLDAGALEADEAATRLGLALSTANEPAQAAAWVEGLLKGSGLLLLHDEALWDVLDRWVSSIPSETFPQVLPLLRRTFSTFPGPERRQMGERVKRGGARAAVHAGALAANPEDFDTPRAEATLPLLARLLGVSLPEDRP